MGIEEEDFLLRQIRAIGHGGAYTLIRALKMSESKIDYGQVEDKKGNTISRIDAIAAYMENYQVYEAYQEILALKYRLSVYDYTKIKDVFVLYLRNLEEEKKKQLSLSEEQIREYENKLNEL